MKPKIDRFKLTPNVWYACQMIPGYRRKYNTPYYSPIYINKILPKKTGKSILQIDFINALYAQERKEFSMNLQIFKHAENYLVAEPKDSPDQVVIISKIEFGWIENYCPELWDQRPPSSIGGDALGNVSKYLSEVFLRKDHSGDLSNPFLAEHGFSKVAKQTDWVIELMPDKKATISLDRFFSLKEMKLIRRGLIPDQMEDKWFVYFQKDALYFHRSWTGICIFIVRFVREGEGSRMTEADVCRDRDRITESQIKEDAAMIVYLIDTLLLHRVVEYPGIGGSAEEKTLEEWGVVGQAMLGKHPNTK